MSQHDRYWDLIVLVLNKEATQEEEDELQCWIALTEENRLFFEKSRKVIALTQRTGVIPIFDTNQAWTKVHQEIHRSKEIRSKRVRIIARYSGAAAALLILFIGIAFLQNSPKPEPRLYVEDIQPGNKKATLILDDGSIIEIGSQPIAIAKLGTEIRNDSLKSLDMSARMEEESKQPVKYSTLVIPRGGEYKITLQDGSSVWLNSGSELRFPSYFSGGCREVELKGEAYFRVAHDSKKPFFVKTQDTKIKVYGTEFNVYAYEDEDIIATTLVKGSVSMISSLGQETLILPSEQLSYSKSSRKSEVKTVDINLYTSWINGVYSFENATLEDIMSYIRRWYNFDVDYEHASMRHVRFTGEFQKDKPLSYGLELIRLTCEVNFRINGNQVTITP